MKNETDREKIIELVEKLLAMTEDAGCTQAEAVQFALKAQRLIAEHDISEDELGQRRGCGEIGPVFARSARREWRSLLALAIAENFRCKTYLEYCKTLGARRNVKVVFYGYESDARAAAFTFDHLYDAGHRLARDARTGRMLKGDAYRSFTAGFVDGVRGELEKQSVALMLVLPLEVAESYEEFSEDFGTARRLQGWYDDYALREQGERAGRDSVRAARVGEGGSSQLLAG